MVILGMVCFWVCRIHPKEGHIKRMIRPVNHHSLVTWRREAVKKAYPNTWDVIWVMWERERYLNIYIYIWGAERKVGTWEQIRVTLMDDWEKHGEQKYGKTMRFSHHFASRRCRKRHGKIAGEKTWYSNHHHWYRKMPLSFGFGPKD